jgi:hypothetical protein
MCDVYTETEAKMWRCQRQIRKCDVRFETSPFHVAGDGDGSIAIDVVAVVALALELVGLVIVYKS